MNPWDQILSRVETKVNRRFCRRFKPTRFVSEETAAITVRVPSTLFKDWLTKHYSGVISEAMGEVKKASLAVNFVPDAQAGAGTTPSVPTKPRQSKLRLP